MVVCVLCAMPVLSPAPTNQPPGFEDEVMFYFRMPRYTRSDGTLSLLGLCLKYLQ